MSVADLAVETNLKTVLERVAGLPDRVDIACFPELTLTGFVPDERAVTAAVSPGGPERERPPTLGRTL